MALKVVSFGVGAGLCLVFVLQALTVTTVHLKIPHIRGASYFFFFLKGRVSPKSVTTFLLVFVQLILDGAFKWHTSWHAATAACNAITSFWKAAPSRISTVSVYNASTKREKGHQLIGPLAGECGLCVFSLGSLLLFLSSRTSEIKSGSFYRLKQTERLLWNGNGKPAPTFMCVWV